MADLIDRREAHWADGLYRRGHSYRFRRRVHGKIVVKCFGRIPFDEAERNARHLNMDLEDGKDILQAGQGARMTFAAHAQEWLQKKRASLGESKTLRRYRAIIDNFCFFLNKHRLGKARLSEIGYSVCDDYVTDRRIAPIMPNGHRPSTQSNKFTRTCACKNGAAKKLYIQKRPSIRPFSGRRSGAGSLHQTRGMMSW